MSECGIFNIGGIKTPVCVGIFQMEYHWRGNIWDSKYFENCKTNPLKLNFLNLICHFAGSKAAGCDIGLGLESGTRLAMITKDLILVLTKQNSNPKIQNSQKIRNTKYNLRAEGGRQWSQKL